MDLSSVPVIDVHCHAVSTQYAVLEDPHDLARLISLGAMGNRDWPAEQVSQTLFFRRLIRELAGFLGCEATLMAVVEARNARATNYAAYVTELLMAVGAESFLVDTGYPRDPAAVSFFCGLGLPVRTIFRIEPLIERLSRECTSFSELLCAFRDECARQIAAGNVGFKSVIAYRTGLAIDRVDRAQAEGAFPGFVAGVREAAKLVRDFLVAEVAGLCLDLDVPLQLHVGLGDYGIELDSVRPSLLVPFLSRFNRLKLVCVHGGYPWVEETACLCHLYPYVYLDLSEWVPLAYPGLGRKLLEALSIAPVSRIVYGSDGFNLPELHWLGARLGREAVGFALDTLIAEGALTAAQAAAIARMILADNARDLYRLDQTERPA